MDKKKGCLAAGLGCGGFLFLVVCLLAILFIFSGGDGAYETTNLKIDGLRDYYTQLKGGGEDTATVMVYMIGSDLETDGGAASADIEEMLEAGADNINIVIHQSFLLYHFQKSVKQQSSHIVLFFFFSA